jgi:hypothetical protein
MLLQFTQTVRRFLKAHEMEAIKFAFVTPIGIIALFFVFIGWRRGIRFNFHDYQGDKKERLRDNFFSSFTIITSLGCLIPIIFPFDLWGFAIPLYLLMVFVITPVSMLGAYWSSFLGNVMTGARIRNNGFFWQSSKDISVLEWYEFTPFAFVGGWVVCYLVYVSLLLVMGYRIMSEDVPAWFILVGLTVGTITAVIAAFGINRKFKKHEQMS